MGKRGTKPKPTALKLLAGAQPCRINGSEPIGPEGIPTPPKFVEGDGLEMWNELAPMLAAMGVLTRADRYGFGLLCDSYRRFLEAPADEKRRAEFRRMLAEYGLTASSRSGIKTAAVEPKDDFADFMRSKA